MGDDKSMPQGKIPLCDVMGKINKKYGAGTIMQASKSRALDIDRMQSGLFAIDRLSEGGWPIGRIIQIYGDWSSCKSSVLLKSVSNAQRHCHHCLGVIQGKEFSKVEKLCGCDTPKPWETVWIDLERAFDRKWAGQVGVDLDLVNVCRPETGEQAMDILDGLARQSDVAYIIVDTITMLSPKDELTKSLEEGRYDKRASIMNTTIRKLLAAQGSEGMDVMNKLTIFLVCQINMNIGSFMTTEGKSGGKTKEFANSFELRFKRAKTHEFGTGRFSEGCCEVKKTRISSTLGDKAVFNLFTRGCEQFSKGSFSEIPMLFRACKDLGIIFKEGKYFKAMTETGIVFPDGLSKEDDLRAYLAVNYGVVESLQRFTLDYLYGADDGST